MDHHHNDTDWMRQAIALAARALASGDTPVGALVVRGGEVLAEGIEGVRAGLDISAHAEIVAVREACRAVGGLDLSGCTLYTTAEPCWMCAFAIRQARVARVIIGRDAPGIGGGGPPHAILLEPGVPGWGEPPEVVRGVLAGACTTASIRARAAAGRVELGPWRGNGLIHRRSPFTAAQTLERLQAELERRNIKIFARLDHRAAAGAVGMTMPAATVLVFGSPRGGTPLMMAAPTLAIDLPFKALVWEDTAGQVWVSCNQPAYLAQRHGLAATKPELGGLQALVACVREVLGADGEGEVS